MAERKLELDPKDYPANSHNSKGKEKSIEKVVQGTVKTKKSPLRKKLGGEILSGDDMENIRSYIFFDVLVPAIKETLWNIISGASERLIFGEKGSRSKSNKKYTAYDKASYKRNDRTTQHTSRTQVDDVIFESRGDAQEVLDSMFDVVVDYGAVSVADMYDLIGLTGNFTDNKYGWTDLDGVTVKLTRDGYILDLPRAELLD